MACDQCNECNECVDPCNEECLGCTLKINDDCVFLGEAIPGLDSPVGTTYNDVITEILEDITALQALLPAVDYVNDVTLNGNTLAFLGTGNAFTGNVDLGPALAGLSKYELLYNDVIKIIVGTTGTPIVTHTFTLVGNTLGVDGSFLRITTDAVNRQGSLIEVLVDGQVIMSTTGGASFLEKTWFEAEFTRRTSMLSRTNNIVSVAQSPTVYFRDYLDWGVNFAVDHDITVQVTNPSVDNVTVNNLKVEIFKK